MARSIDDAQRAAKEHYKGAEFIARKGEWLCCESGHKICQVAQDIKPADRWLPENFTQWLQAEPVVGATLVRCVICQAPFYDNSKGLHFKGGWR